MKTWAKYLENRELLIDLNSPSMQQNVAKPLYWSLNKVGNLIATRARRTSPELALLQNDFKKIIDSMDLQYGITQQNLDDIKAVLSQHQDILHRTRAYNELLHISTGLENIARVIDANNRLRQS
jgi:hypothetical protein